MAFTLHTPGTCPGTNGTAAHDGWERAQVSLVSEIDPLVAQITSAMQAAGYTNREAFAVRLALEEAIVNAIKHGHQGDPSKVVRVACRVSAEQVVLEVEDQGPGFQPEEVPDPLDPENLERACGRGVFLMRHYMTEVTYNARGNCVTLCKRRA